jgi:hypothetical protein
MVAIAVRGGSGNGGGRHAVRVLRNRNVLRKDILHVQAYLLKKLLNFLSLFLCEGSGVSTRP